MRCRAMTVLALLVGASCADDTEPAGGTGSSTTSPDSGEAQSDNNGDPTESTTPSTSTTGSGSSSTTQTTTAGETEGTTGEPPPTAEVHLVGRFDEGQQFTWSGTTMRTRISGTELDLQLDGAGGVRFQVVVDGTPTEVFETLGGPQTYAVATGSPRGSTTSRSCGATRVTSAWCSSSTSFPERARRWSRHRLHTSTGSSSSGTR